MNIYKIVILQKAKSFMIGTQGNVTLDEIFERHREAEQLVVFHSAPSATGRCRKNRRQREPSNAQTQTAASKSPTRGEEALAEDWKNARRR